MKNIQLIKPIILFLMVIAGFTSCETTELDLLQNPLDITQDNLDPEFLFNNIQLGFNNFVTNAAGDASFTSQVTRSFAMQGGNQYANAFAPVSFNGIWASGYAGVLQDIKALEPLAQEIGLTYHLGASKIMRAYVLLTLVDMFGDVPYSEALLGNGNLNPNADDQVAVYMAALTDLDEAIEMLAIETSILPGDDMFFARNDAEGNVTADLQENWITVAKSLKLRTYNNIRLNSSPLSINVVDEINALLLEDDLIDTPEEDWQFNYGPERLDPNSRHPGYNRYYEGTATGYMSNYLMWAMTFEKGIDDPRLRYYFYRQDIDATDEDLFTLGCTAQNAPVHYGNVSSIYNNELIPFCVADVNRGYWGRDHGANFGIPPDVGLRTVYGVYPAGGLFDEDQAASVQNEGEDGNLTGAGITPILLSSHINFIKAEAQLELGTTGSARTFLIEGIISSFDKVLGFDENTAASSFAATAGDQNNYLGTVVAAFDAASNSEKLDIIMKEAYISSFGNGLEVYNGYRRTGFPSNYQPTLEPVSGDFYRSALYPANYVNLNANATQKDRTERVFWDTNPQILN